MAGIPETWDKIYQVTHYKIPVYPAISNFRLAAGLKVGDTVNRQYRSNMRASNMAGDGGYRRQALTDTNETLAIDKAKESSFYIKELDEIQNSLPVRAKYAQDASASIFNQIDGDVLGKYDQFTSSLDDADLGGTSGNGIAVTVSNVRRLFTNSSRLLQRANIMLDNTAKFTGFKKEDSQKEMAVAIMSPDVYQVLLESLDGKDTALGDKVGVEGHAGRYMGYELFVSNAVGWSGKLLLGTQPTDGDTVVINGVTLTFKTTLGTTAGNILIGASAATANDAIVAVVNDSESLSIENGGAGPATVGTLYVELSQANRDLLNNFTATDGTTFTTIKATGWGFVIVSETLTAAADVWTPELQIQHLLFGVANSIDVVIQKTPGLKIKDRDGKVGMDFVTWAAYGIKVFHEHVVKMIDVWVRTDTYTS